MLLIPLSLSSCPRWGDVYTCCTCSVVADSSFTPAPTRPLLLLSFCLCFSGTNTANIRPIFRKRGRRVSLMDPLLSPVVVVFVDVSAFEVSELPHALDSSGRRHSVHEASSVTPIRGNSAPDTGTTPVRGATSLVML